MRISALLAALLLAWVAPAALAESAVTVKAVELKKTPATDGETVASLPENTSVDVLQRQGPWTQVKSGGQTGWLRMLALRSGDTASRKAGDSGLGALLNVARSGSSGTTVATGVRGLSAEDIQQAHEDHQELKKLERYKVSAAEARSFAVQGKLAEHGVDYLPAPAGTGTANTEQPGWGAQ